MHRYFLSKEEFLNKKIEKDFHHIKNVVKLKVNENIEVGYLGKVYKAFIKDFLKETVIIEIEDKISADTELDVKVDIFQGYPKGDKIKDIIKYGVSFGMHSLTPFISSRCIIKLDSQKIDNKLKSFNLLSYETSRTSKRLYVPIINKPINLKDINFEFYDKLYVAYEDSSCDVNGYNLKNELISIAKDEKIGIIIGPEGGFSENEIKFLVDNGAKIISLGKRILKTELAICYILSTISYEREYK